MALLYSATASDRTDLAADGGRDVTRGALLVWAYLTATNIGRFGALVDPVGLRNCQEFGIISAGATVRMAHDFVTTDLIVDATLTNFAAYGTSKWLRIAFLWDHGAGGTAQKIFVGDEGTGLAEPSAYITQQDGAGGWQARDASSFWKLGNRRQNDTNLKGRLAYAMLVDRSAGANPTAAEMDRWFKAPGRFDNAVWGFELGVGGDGLSPRNVFGSSSFVGTVTGATVDAHIAMKPFLTRSIQGPGATGGVMQRTRRRVTSVRPATLVSTFRGAYTTLQLSAARGSLQINGQPATIQSGLFMTAVRGTVTLVGRTPALSLSTLATPAARGSATVVGRPATPTPGTNAIATQRGAVSITGRSAGTTAGAISVAAARGAVWVQGRAAILGDPPAGAAGTLFVRRGARRLLHFRQPRR